MSSIRQEVATQRPTHRAASLTFRYVDTQADHRIRKCAPAARLVDLRSDSTRVQPELPALKRELIEALGLVDIVCGGRKRRLQPAAGKSLS